MTVVVFGTYDDRQHPRVRVLIEALVGLGHHVIRCNEPLDLSTSERIRVVRRPWLVGPLVVRLVSRWWHLSRKAQRIGRKTPDLVLVAYLGVFDVHLARLCFDAPVILDHMAPVGEIAQDRLLSFRRLFALIDRLAVAAARGVIWDTGAHATFGLGGRHHAVVRVGAPYAWFAQSVRSDSTSGPVSVCFFGLYTPLQGVSTIAAAIRILADRDDVIWTLIGDGQDRVKAQALAAGLDGVRWVDWVEAECLPHVVAEHDICLGIFGSGNKAASVVPNKVYQGAAAGCAIVTSDTRPQRDALGDAAQYVPPCDPAALAKVIAELADDRKLLERRKTIARTHAVEMFSPAAIMYDLQRLLEVARR